jgi:outer membrane receptor protein involved in Fe transport
MLLAALKISGRAARRPGGNWLMSCGGCVFTETPRLRWPVLGLTVALWQPLVGAAQSQVAQPADDSSALQEIVVTATRQPQTLDKVPISIAAYSQATLTDLNVQSIDDLSRLTPGITFTRNAFGNGDQSQISIRGISSSVGAATTGVYIDDTPVQVRHRD